MSSPSANHANVSASARWRRFVVSLLWWLMSASSLSLIGNRDLLPTLAVVLGLASLTVVIGLAWASRWASDDRVPLTQFTLGMALLVTLFVAGWLGAIRWLFFTNMPLGGLPATPQEAFRDRVEIAALVTAIGSLWSIIPLFWFADGLVWLAVFLVRRPFAQRILRSMRRPKSPQC
jgi:uncharacterized MnhB-related membrane protein